MGGRISNLVYFNFFILRGLNENARGSRSYILAALVSEVDMLPYPFCRANP